MKIIIVGDGKVGLTLTELLASEGHEIIVVDQNIDVLRHAQELYDVLCVSGNGASMEVLSDAGVDEADLVIAVTSSDETNILCCMTARALGCPHTIARVRNMEYSDQLVLLKETLGLSMTINPELSAAREIYNVLQFPSFISRETFAHGRVEMVSLAVRSSNPLIGKKLYELPNDSKLKVLICAVERREELFIPSGDFVIEEGDKIHVTAQPETLASLIKYLGVETSRLRDVALVGGSKIALHLAKMLTGAGVGVTIIEIDPRRCEELAMILPRVNIINADITNPGVIAEEIRGKADAAVFLLGIDEANIIMSLHASKLGVKKVVSKVDRVDYASISDIIHDETIISPKLHSCNAILRYVRAMSNALSMDDIRAVYRLVNNKAEALELAVPAGSPYLGKTLAELPLRPGVLVACIRRGRSIIFPGGNDSFKASDVIVVFTTAQHHISSFKDLFVR